MRSIRQQPEELKTMVDLNLLELIAAVYSDTEKTIDELTNEEIELFIANGLETSVMMMTESKLEEVINDIRMDMRIDDHVARYHNYLVQVQKVDRQYGLRSYYKTNSKLRGVYINTLIKGIRPFKLKEWVKARMAKLPNDTDRISEHNFWRLLKEGNQHCADFAPMHSKSSEKKAKDKKRKANRRTREQGQRQPTTCANYEVGDFVLWSNVEKRISVDKLMVKWLGPFKVIGTVSDKVYTISHILTNQTRDVHATRLRFYADKYLKITQELREHILTQGFKYTVESFSGVRYNNTSKRYEVCVKWLGFQDIEDSWEDLKTIMQDVPEKAIEFLKKYYHTDSRAIKKIYKQFKQVINSVALNKGLDIEILKH